ncbi:tRNA preQ1(34) S-adenosylmethionine ribosyltransferase-isomerase QueA [Chloroflexota bacterium]
MKTSDFDYSLPAEFIAQEPVEPRDHSRIMVLNRGDGSTEHRLFFEIIDYLQEGDILVFNDSRVIPARLKGRKIDSGGEVEILLLRRLNTNVWETLVKPGKRLPVGTRVEIMSDFTTGSFAKSRVVAEVMERGQNGVRVMSFSDETLLMGLGRVALPPYIHVPLAKPERYQTVYARVDGSVAAPTAGLHFTQQLLSKIRQKGVRCLFVTLHVGLDTFQPVREDDPAEHNIHEEYAVLNREVADELSIAKKEGRRIICVGTTAVRIVEQAAQVSSPEQIQPFEGWINLFILPGYRFHLVDAMVTNFHLPRSTLLMLVSAFTDEERIKQAYQEAITMKYRFYSFGDAMLVL